MNEDKFKELYELSEHDIKRICDYLELIKLQVSTLQNDHSQACYIWELINKLKHLKDDR